MVATELPPNHDDAGTTAFNVEIKMLSCLQEGCILNVFFFQSCEMTENGPQYLGLSAGFARVLSKMNTNLAFLRLLGANRVCRNLLLFKIAGVNVFTYAQACCSSLSMEVHHDDNSWKHVGSFTTKYIRDNSILCTRANTEKRMNKMH